MSSLNPEQLKVIYKGMGWKPVLVFLDDGESDLTYPEPTAEQDRELEIKLLMDTKHVGGKWIATTWNFPTAATGEGDTPAEARCNVAFKHFSEVK